MTQKQQKNIKEKVMKLEIPILIYSSHESFLIFGRFHHFHVLLSGNSYKYVYFCF